MTACKYGCRVQPCSRCIAVREATQAAQKQVLDAFLRQSQPVREPKDVTAEIAVTFKDGAT